MYRRTNIMHIFVSLLQSEDSSIWVTPMTCVPSHKRPASCLRNDPSAYPQHFLDDRPQVCSQTSPIHAAGEKVVAAARKKLRLQGLPQVSIHQRPLKRKMGSRFSETILTWFGEKGWISCEWIGPTANRSPISWKPISTQVCRQNETPIAYPFKPDD